MLTNKLITSVGEESFHFEPGVLRLRAIHVHLNHPVVIAKPNFAPIFNYNIISTINSIHYFFIRYCWNITC
jgi:hypothetical protein